MTEFPEGVKGARPVIWAVGQQRHGAKWRERPVNFHLSEADARPFLYFELQSGLPRIDKHDGHECRWWGSRTTTEQHLSLRDRRQSSDLGLFPFVERWMMDDGGCASLRDLARSRIVSSNHTSTSSRRHGIDTSATRTNLATCRSWHRTAKIWTWTVECPVMPQWVPRLGWTQERFYGSNLGRPLLANPRLGKVVP